MPEQVQNAGLKELSARIGSVKNTQKITDAMKLVAAAKVRRAQDAVVNGRPFSENLVKVRLKQSESLQSSKCSVIVLAMLLHPVHEAGTTRTWQICSVRPSHLPQLTSPAGMDATPTTPAEALPAHLHPRAACRVADHAMRRTDLPHCRSRCCTALTRGCVWRTWTPPCSMCGL